MDNKLKLCDDYTTWSNVPFEDIVDRVSAQKKSSNLPYVEFEDIISGEGILNKNIYERHNVKNGIYFVKGDVLFGKLRPYLKNILLANFNGIAVGDFWVLRSHRVLPYILYLVVNSNKFMRIANISSGSKMPRSDWAIVSKAMITIPESTEEQQKIASYFQSLDSLIQTTSKELASLKQIKAASLQSMFPQEGETVPKVRFKGFEGKWEKIQLNKCLDISNNINIHNTYGINDVLSISDEAGVVNQIEFLGRSFAGKSLQKYKILKTNQLVYTKSPLKAKPYGIIKKNFNRAGIVSTLYAIYDCKDNVSSEFIHYYFDPCYRINQYLSPLVNKGAKNTMNISDETALSGEIWIPSFQEQQKIASYFCNLDKRISLQTQRLEKLKQIKAACLDKMFI